jgi:hypothetical protein
VASPSRISPDAAGLLEPGGHVHGIAGDQALALRRVSGDDLPRVHADPGGQADPLVAFEAGVQRIERRAHALRRPGSSQGVVLVQARDPEHCHHGIPDELLDGAAVSLDHGGHLVEIATHHFAQSLWV